MIAADLTVSAKRAEVLQFTAPFMSNALKILLKVRRGRGANSIAVFFIY